MQSSESNVAHILLAHGSSDELWQEPFRHMLSTVRNCSEGKKVRTELAYMELCAPLMKDVCRQLASDGFTSINIHPLFFSAGKHLRVDVPEQLKVLSEELGITLNLLAPVGQHPEVQNVISDVILENI